MTSRKSELLATLEKYLNNTEVVFEEEFKDVTIKSTLSKEHYSETLSLQTIFCNKDNTTLGSVIVAMFNNGPSVIIVVNVDSSVSAYAVANVLDGSCRDPIISHVDQL